jgi:UDP-N-acetylmuramyl pentapeptide phosphotransferase/UDP-N-acetylglucosamine-1-phosphate transferase
LLSRFTNIFIFDVLNFISRQETLLILGVIVLAGMLGLADDFLNVFKIGGKRGLSMSKRLFMCAVLGLVCALWFYFKLE